MTDITKISKEELMRDLDDSYGDLLTCKAALKLGIEDYTGGSTRDRIETNLKIIDRIETELKRRGN